VLRIGAGTVTFGALTLTPYRQRENLRCMCAVEVVRAVGGAKIVRAHARARSGRPAALGP